MGRSGTGHVGRSGSSARVRSYRMKTVGDY